MSDFFECPHCHNYTATIRANWWEIHKKNYIPAGEMWKGMIFAWVGFIIFGGLCLLISSLLLEDFVHCVRIVVPLSIVLLLVMSFFDLLTRDIKDGKIADYEEVGRFVRNYGSCTECNSKWERFWILYPFDFGWSPIVDHTYSEKILFGTKLFPYNPILIFRNENMIRIGREGAPPIVTAETTNKGYKIRWGWQYEGKRDNKT